MPRLATKSLEEFAQENPLRGLCSTCQLPEDVLKQVNDGLIQKMSKTTILRWLSSLGIEGVTRNKLRNHAEHVKA